MTKGDGSTLLLYLDMALIIPSSVSLFQVSRYLVGILRTVHTPNPTCGVLFDRERHTQYYVHSEPSLSHSSGEVKIPPKLDPEGAVQ